MSNLSTLILSGSVKSIADFPEIIANYHSILHSKSLESLKKHCLDYTNLDYILICADLPVSQALYVQKHFSNAQFIVQDDTTWLDLNTQKPFDFSILQVQGTVEPKVVNQAQDVIVNEPILDAELQLEVEKEEPKVIQKMINPQYLIHEIFKYCSWGLKDKSQADQVEQMLQQLAEIDVVENKGFTKRGMKAKEQGLHAYEVWQGLETQLKKLGNNAEFKQIFDTACMNEPSEKVRNSLKITLKKKLKSLEEQKSKKKTYTNHSGVISPVVTAKQPHPNSLKHLPTHNEWDIYIDETGNVDEIDTQKLGKVIALAVPKGKVKLPKLANDFHANKEKESVLDKGVNTLLSQPVGIIGLSINDDLADSSPRWISLINNLVELTLRLLPLPMVENNNKNKVRIHIENRGTFTKDIDLQIMRELIMAKLQSLDAKFEHLSLSMQFMEKNIDIGLDYADLIANTWYGKTKKDRLKKSKWLGNCLLNPQEFSLDRMYALLEDKQELKPDMWYQVAGNLSSEPEHSLIVLAMNKLGENSQKNPNLWQSYLDEVQMHLSNKDYKPHQLDSALSWLKTYKPANHIIPLQMELKWIAAKTATDNHMGRIDKNQVNRIIELEKMLHDEVAPEVCQTLLRLAVVATNNFEFSSALDVLNHSKQPIDVIGRLNHAKLLSSFGQYYAFTYDFEKANDYFNQAIATFNQYSDLTQRKKNVEQTNVYRLLNMIDSGLISADDIKSELVKHFNKPINKILNQFKILPLNSPFNHHLLLRAFVAYPTEFQAEIKTYLANILPDVYGQDHPWNLIHLWRGYLFMLQNDKTKAKQQFELATYVLDDEDTDYTLRFIRLIIATVAQRLLGSFNYAFEEESQTLKANLPFAPHDAVLKLRQNEQNLLENIAKCLPFNFK